MYKVFFNDRIVLINTAFEESVVQNGILSAISNDFDVHIAWRNFLNDPSKGNLFLTGDTSEKVLQLLMKNFKVVEAAGGLVLNELDQLLCIYRWNKWDLPKGKIEKGETIEAAAVREVEEETGINGVRILESKGTTYHIFKSPYVENKLILKPTHWFLMKYSGNQVLTPQIKEDIVKAQWFNKWELDVVKRNTYASLAELFDF